MTKCPQCGYEPGKCPECRRGKVVGLLGSVWTKVFRCDRWPDCRWMWTR